MPDDKERLARLEAEMDGMQDLLQEMRSDIKELRQDWVRARGLVAGVVLTVSAVWGVLLAGWSFIKHKFA